jgi:hypothetical protein
MDDLFHDDSPQSIEPSRQSLKSFWGLVACVAIAAFFATALAYWMREMVDYHVDRILNNPWRSKHSPISSVVFDSCLVPSLVAVAVTPLLYWRGGLAQRFTLSLMIAIAAMNLNSHQGSYYFGSKVNWNLMAIMVLLWGSLPILFLYTPMSTRPLRFFATACILGTAFCVGMSYLEFAPFNHRILCWEATYGAALGYALIQRNWGRIATLEDSANANQIERTSSRTLLELMSVSAMACVATSFWSVSLNNDMVASLAIAALFGPLPISFALYYFKHSYNGWSRVVICLMMVLTLAVLFSLGGLLRPTLQFYWNSMPIREFAIVSLVSGLGASVILTSFIVLVDGLLRVFRWRVVDSRQLPTLENKLD